MYNGLLVGNRSSNSLGVDRSISSTAHGEGCFLVMGWTELVGQGSAAVPISEASDEILVEL